LWRATPSPVATGTRGSCRFGRKTPEVRQCSDPLACRLALEAPSAAGDYTLVITLVQEQVRWFDEADERNGVAYRIRVT